MLLPVHVDAVPPKLFDRDKRLVNVRILRDKVSSQVESKAFGMKDVGRRLREIWGDVSGTKIGGDRGVTHGR